MKLMTTLVVAALVGLASATDPTIGTDQNPAPARNNLRGGNDRMAPTSPLAAAKPASPHTQRHHPSTSHQPTEAARPTRQFVSTPEDSHEQRPKALATPKARSPQHDEWHSATSHPPRTGPQPAIHRESFIGVDGEVDAKHPRPQHHPVTSRPPSNDQKPAKPEHERKPVEPAGGRELLSDAGEAAEVNGVPVDDFPKSPRRSNHQPTIPPPTTAPPMPRPVVAREFVAESNKPKRHPKPAKKHDTPAPPPSPHHQLTTQPPVARFHA